MRVCLVALHAFLLVLASGPGLGCASQRPHASSGPPSTTAPELAGPTDAETEKLWAEAAEVWAKYVEFLRTRNCDGAAELTAEGSFEPFVRIREAALSLNQKHLMGMRPQDVVHVLVLRGRASTVEVAKLTSRDVFLALCSAGALNRDLGPTIEVVHQIGNGLYHRSGNRWWPVPRLVLTSRGVRVLAAVAEFEGRFGLMNRLGVDLGQGAELPPQALLDEASRILGRQSHEAAWRPLLPISPAERAEGEAALDATVGLEDPLRSSLSATTIESETEEVERSNENAASRRLPATVMRNLIRSQFPAFDVCYVDALLRNPRLSGRVVVQFVIGLGGRVVAAGYGTDFTANEVPECLVAQFRTLRFPEPRGGILRVEYPFAFSPGAGPLLEGLL